MVKNSIFTNENMGKVSFQNCIELIKLLRIDVFFFMGSLGTSLPSIAINQLIQDKYCLNKYSVNETICLNLENAGSEYESVRNDVLKDATTLKMYTTIATSIPGIFTSLFMGYWIDAYPGHLRYLLGITGFSVVCQNVMIIYQCLYFEIAPMSLLYTRLIPILTGSGAIITIGAFTYVTRQTSAKYRAVRFTIMEIALFATMSISSSLGGSLISANPWFPGQHRNYIGVYIVASIISASSATWVVLLLYDNSFIERDEDQESIINNEHQQSANDDDGVQTNIVIEKKTFKMIFRDITKMDNVFHAGRCVFKRRPNNAHWCLISTIAAGLIAKISHAGEQTIGYQFNQRVYHWTAEQIGYYNSIIMIVPSLGAILGPPLFIHKMGLHDSALAIIGLVSILFAFSVKGIILSPISIFVSIFACFSGVIFVADRSILSRMIQEDEIGQVYAFSTSVGAIVPTLSSLLYSQVFKATIDSNPGLVYLIAASLFVYPLCNAIWLNRTKDKWDLVLIAEKQN